MNEAASYPPVSGVIAALARWPAAVLLALAVLVWLPGVLSLPPLDRDESRFAQASKQMVETGDFVDIRLGEGTRYNKPAGIYWLQAVAAKIFGQPPYNRIWTYRLPSLLGGYLALLLLYWCARALAPPETALAAAGLLGASLLMTAETQIATTDAVLLAAILGAQGALLRVYLAARGAAVNQPRLPVLLAGWFAVAAAILIKGPIIVAVLGVTALAVSIWDREWRWLKGVRPMLGLVFVLAIAAPWFVAIAIHSQGAFYRQSLGHDLATKMVGGQESHGAPPGYYLALATVTLWPAILFVLPSLRAAWFARAVPATRYLLCWAGATWLLFELVPTKLPHYVLPAYPALAILCACWGLGPRNESVSVFARALRGISGLQFFLGLAAIAAVVVLAPEKYGNGVIWPLVFLAVPGCIVGLIALGGFFRDRQPLALLASIAAAALLFPLLSAGVAPRLDALWVSSRAAALVQKDRRPDDPPTVLAGYVEPSLIFLLGTDTRASIGDGAARIAAQQGGLALIEDREQAGFLAALGALDTEAYPVDSLSGFDYSHGRKTHITIYRVVPLSASPAGE